MWVVAATGRKASSGMGSWCRGRGSWGHGRGSWWHGREEDNTTRPARDSKLNHLDRKPAQDTPMQSTNEGCIN